MPEVILKLTFVVQTVFVVLSTFSALLVVLKTALIMTTRLIGQQSLPMPFSVEHVTVIVVSVGPAVVTCTIGKVMSKLASEYLSTVKGDGSVSFFHKLFHLSLISCHSLSQDSKTLNNIRSPLSNITDSLVALPHSTTLFFTSTPFTVIYLSVTPPELSLSLPFALCKLPCVAGPIRVLFVSYTIRFSHFKLTLIDSSSLIKENTFAFWHSILVYLSYVAPTHYFLISQLRQVQILHYLKLRLIVIDDPLFVYRHATFCLIVSDWLQGRSLTNCIHFMNFCDLRVYTSTLLMIGVLLWQRFLPLSLLTEVQKFGQKECLVILAVVLPYKRLLLLIGFLLRGRPHGYRIEPGLRHNQ